MQNTHSTNVSDTLNALKSDIMQTIKRCCEVEEFGIGKNTLEIGTAQIHYDFRSDTVLFKSVDSNLAWMPIDCPDAYPDLLDLANWADICEDYIAFRTAHPKDSIYSVLWNVSGAWTKLINT